MTKGRGKGFHLLRHTIQRSIVWGRLPGNSILCSRIRKSTGTLIAFRRCKNLKDILVRVRLSNEGNGGTDKKGCSRYLVVKCVMS